MGPSHLLPVVVSSCDSDRHQETARILDFEILERSHPSRERSTEILRRKGALILKSGRRIERRRFKWAIGCLVVDSLSEYNLKVIDFFRVRSCGVWQRRGVVNIEPYEVAFLQIYRVSYGIGTGVKEADLKKRWGRGVHRAPVVPEHPIVLLWHV